jgi:hypothetical protein
MMSRKRDGIGRVNCIPSSVATPNSNGFFHAGTPEGVCFCTPSQNHCRYCGKPSHSCDNGKCQCVQVQKNALLNAAICLEIDKTPCQTRTVTRWHPWFDHDTLHHFLVMWILKITDISLHILCNTSHLSTAHYTTDSLCVICLPT